MTSSRQTAYGLLFGFGLLSGAAACHDGKGEKAALPARAANTAASNGEETAAASGSAAASPEAGSDAPAAAPLAHEVAAVPAPAPQQVTLRLTGQVTSVRSSKVAFKVAGFIASVVAKPGAVVKKGDVLGTLDDEDFKIKLELSQAKRDQAKVALTSAKNELTREKQLKADNASTATVYEQRETAFEQARLGLRLAELDVVQNERNFGDTKLRAPYDCIVREQLKFEGENVPSGTAAFEVVDTSAPEITFEAPEAMLGKIKIGAALDVQVPSGGYTGKAEVVRIVPVISEKTRTFRIIAALPGGIKSVVPGSYAEAKVD